MQDEMKGCLAEIEVDLPLAKWALIDGPARETNTVGVLFYEGSTSRWHFMVCSFETESQGFPPGSRGHDGAATKQGVVLHLTRELAKRAVSLAEKQLVKP